ncbi:hypothetical protein P9112_012245 [Eukaryota sp. TZLM1-RC]
MRFLVPLALFLCCTFAASNWAVIVAGSKGYSNYRHQSDVYHAVQMLRNNGYSDSNIIVMQENDIAFNARNPIKGEVYNNPEMINYYDNIPMDYTGNAVTPQNFLAVLSGRKDKVEGGSGRVIESDENTNILVLYYDHGSPGLVAFPHGGYLYVKPLRETVEWMYKNKKYNKMVMYIEACESGSMFHDWSDDLAKLNVYAATAANPVESSYAHYWSSEVSAYLGDEFSITYMEDIDENGVDQTLDYQFKNAILSRVKGSHPQQYGNMTIAQEPLRNYFATENGKTHSAKLFSRNRASNAEYEIMNTYDLKLRSLQKAHDLSKSVSERTRLSALIKAEERRREWTDSIFSSLVDLVAPGFKSTGLLTYTKIDHECYQASVENFTASCGVVSDYGMRYLRIFANLCEVGVQPEVIALAAREICH